jgi:hypothetical protein
VSGRTEEIKMGFVRVMCVMQVTAVIAVARPAEGQTPPTSMPGMSMNMPMPSTAPLGIDEARSGSGTSWLPDETSMRGVMGQVAGWSLMTHGTGFLEFDASSGPRGDHEFGSVNWVMGMASRPVGGGLLAFRGMVSLEPLTVGRCGYPDLLQTGEQCRGVQLHDAQHPHDLFMELAADYRRALNGTVAVEVYGGPAGEPALGPVAFPHRPSAMDSPVAPIAHHWLDSTHVSFGVLTGGLYGRRWKVEASAFNGREPDDRRYGVDVAALDSYSGRIWWLPTARWALQFSGGHLKDAEATSVGAREDVDRVTASAAYHRRVEGRLWATTVAWGRNAEAGRSSSALLAETSFAQSTRNTWFGRAEVVGKSPAELSVPLTSVDPLLVSKLEGGYTRAIGKALGTEWRIGGTLGRAMVPASLATFYGSRSPIEATVFVRVR